jgi:acetylornithine deacetylase
MNPSDLIAFARELIDIDSTTGQEAAAGQWLAAQLRQLGYTVAEQPLDGGRRNIFAHLDPPIVVLSTHYDCVPPFFPSALRDGRLYGRGACDAKGILAAQVAAAERLRARGERRVGLLFVAGEERGSDGARAANALAPGSKFLINGEPTDSRLASATRGVLRVRLHARGRPAHSAAPEQGESAIDKLVDAILRLRGLALPSDPDLGRTYYTVGLIEGGVAPNVIPPHASAEVVFRAVGPLDRLRQAISALEPLVTIEDVLHVPLVRLHVLPGFDTAAFPFTTDLPFLDRWGAPLLFGPGSFLVAHTSDEHVAIDELERAVGSYERLAVTCLQKGT